MNCKSILKTLGTAGILYAYASVNALGIDVQINNFMDKTNKTCKKIMFSEFKEEGYFNMMNDQLLVGFSVYKVKEGIISLLMPTVDGEIKIGEGNYTVNTDGTCIAGKIKIQDEFLK